MRAAKAGGLNGINQSVILLLLDISAAFDTINHDFLLSRLKSCFGICDKALDWFSMYLSGRRQFFKVNDMSSTSYLTEQGCATRLSVGYDSLFSLGFSFRQYCKK